MAIRVVCPQCAKVLSAPDIAAGKRARCSGCQTVMRVPVPTPPVEDDGYRVAELAPQAPPPKRSQAASPVAKQPAARPPAPQSAPRVPRPASADPASQLLAAAAAAPALPRKPAPTLADVPISAAATKSSTTPTAGRANATAVKAKPKATRGAGWLRNYVYLVFALALIPLAWSILSPSHDMETRIARTIEANPEVFSAAEAEELDMAGLFARLPGGRFEGAHLPRSTWTHWIYGLISAAAFLGVILVAFQRGQANPVSIALVALCTATAGIIFLLTVQYIAAATQGVWIRGRGVGILVFLVIKLIGFSYNAADDPANGFLLSFFGYTIGVGLCEELTKALPVIFRCRSQDKFTWRAAVMWGLASGVGFGVAEGIMYSGRYYNGFQSGEIYVIRFVSCVALHAVWSAAVALLIWNNADDFQSDSDWPDLALAVLKVLAIPMVLHGLYDTMLKKDMAIWALVTAAASFVFLTVLVEYTRRQQEEPEPRPMLAAGRAVG